MLSSVELTEARRFMGYPVHGADPSGNMGWQYYQAAGQIEYRLSNLSDSEETVVRQYIGTLEVLERAIPGASAGLDTGSAAGWVRNPAELGERLQLFDDWRRRFCAFLGVVPGAGLVRNSSASVALVV